jgi:hypothetical protein
MFYILHPLSYEQLAKIFSYSEGCFLILVIVSFDVLKLLNFMRSRLSILISWATKVLLRK